MKFLILFALLSSLVFSQAQKKKILIERQSSASCSACANAHKQFQPFIENLEDDVVVVTYQRHDNSHLDPMGLFITKLGINRMQEYYNNLSFPTAFVDGGDRRFLTSLLELEPTDENANVKIELESTIKNNLVELNIDLENTSGFGVIQDPNTKLFAIIKEKTVEYDVAPGSNGEKIFHDVLRYMFGSPIGFALNWNESGNSEITLDQEVDTKVVDANDIYAVVFLQNVETGEVFQAQEIKIDISSSIEEKIQNQTTIYPNPASDLIQIENLLIGELFTIYDSSGDEIINGEYSGKIDVSNLSSGVYFVGVAGRTIKFIKD